MEHKLPYNSEAINDIISSTIPINYRGPFDNRANITRPENSAGDFPEATKQMRYKNQRTLDNLYKQITVLRANPKTSELLEGLIRLKSLSHPLITQQPAEGNTLSRTGMDVYTLLQNMLNSNSIQKEVEALLFDPEVYAAVNNCLANHDNTIRFNATVFSTEEHPGLASYKGIDNTANLASQNNVTDLITRFAEKQINLLVSTRDLDDVELTNLIIIALNSMSQGGNLVVRIAQPYTNIAACLTYLVTTMFVEVSLTSPITQRTSDFGWYLVAKKFRTIGERSIQAMTDILTQYSCYIKAAALRPGLFTEVSLEYFTSYKAAYQTLIDYKATRIQNMSVLLTPYLVQDIKLDPISDLRQLIETATLKWVESVGFVPVKRGARESTECEKGCPNKICAHLGNQIRAIMNSKSDFYRNKVLRLFNLESVPQNLRTDSDYYNLLVDNKTGLKDNGTLYPEYMSDTEINEHVQAEPNQIIFSVWDVDDTRSRITALYLDISRISGLLATQSYSDVIANYYSRYKKFSEWAEYLGDMLLEHGYVLREKNLNPRFGYSTLTFQKC